MYSQDLACILIQENNCKEIFKTTGNFITGWVLLHDVKELFGFLRVFLGVMMALQLSKMSLS